MPLWEMMKSMLGGHPPGGIPFKGGRCFASGIEAHRRRKWARNYAAPASGQNPLLGQNEEHTQANEDACGDLAEAL